MKRFIECPECHQMTNSGKQYTDLNGFIICFWCKSVVGIKYEKELVAPSTILDIKWNPENLKNTKKIDDKILFSLVKNEKDEFVISLLVKQAQQEDDSFRRFDSINKGAVLIENNEYIGFVVWSQRDTCVLRQIFIKKEKRKKGLGTKLLKFWIDEIAKKINKKYGIESPNAVTLRMLKKTGHLKTEEKNGKEEIIDFDFSLEQGF